MKKDEDLLFLRDMVVRGWPSNLPATILPYWIYKDELACYNGVLLKGDRVVIPSSLVFQVLQDIHRGHLGIEKSRLQARRCVFWPNMNLDISNITSQCSTCQTYAGPQPKHYSYNMQYVGTDIFEYRGVNYLIVVDYFSSYPWIRSLKNTTTKSTIGALKPIFTEFGYPQRIHSPILGERMSSIILPQQRKQWLSVELNRWRSEIIHCYFKNNKNRTLIIIM